MKHTVATIVTRMLDPFTVLALLFVVALTQSSLTTPSQIMWFVLSGLMMIGIPLGIFLIFLHTGKIKNWDVSDRRERPKLFLFVLLYELFCLYFVRPLVDVFLFETFVTVIVAFTGFSLITLFWKISGHAFINALASGLFILWFGWAWWPVLFIAPLVGWSRVVRGDHTVAQVIFGSLYGWIMIVLMNWR